MKKIIASAIIALSVTSMFSSCGYSFDVTNIRHGMTRDEVHLQLGQPDWNGKTQECWRERYVPKKSNNKGDYCINFSVEGTVDEYGWASMHKIQDDDDFVFIAL